MSSPSGGSTFMTRRSASSARKAVQNVRQIDHEDSGERKGRAVDAGTEVCLNRHSAFLCAHPCKRNSPRRRVGSAITADWAEVDHSFFPVSARCRIVGALANLGFEVSDQTVGNVLRRHGVPPAPERKRTTTWPAFIRTHLALLAGTDFFTVEVPTLRGLATCYVPFFIHLA
jgi:hypothetical protein